MSDKSKPSRPNTLLVAFPVSAPDFLGVLIPIPAEVFGIINLDAAGEVESVSDGASTLAVYLSLCKQAGLSGPNVLMV